MKLNESVDPRIQPFIDRIRYVCPDFHVMSVRWLDSGQNNFVLILNDSWIFRFARHHLGSRSLESEVAVLRHLNGMLPLQIPFPEYVYLDQQDSPLSFMGYRMISGVPLTRERAITATDDNLETVSRELVGFLRTLHAVSVPKDIVNVIPFHNATNYWSDIFDRVQRLLLPFMRVEAREQVVNNFESFLSASQNVNIPVSLIHGDFGGRNILLRDDHRRVVGVIDFGSVSIGDPAVDYAAVSTVHPRMFDLIATHDSDVRRYASRVEFYKGTFALQEALYGAESGDEQAFRSGMEQYI